MDDGGQVFIENRTFDELCVGETASLTHTVSQRDIDLFAAATGDLNPAHVDPAFAETDMFHGIIAHGMWGAGLISAVLGTKLPGPGTIYLGQDLRFRHPVRIGDTITATLRVSAKHPEKGDVTLDCVCTNQRGEAVITGTAETRAPTVKVRRPEIVLPRVQIDRHDRLDAIIAGAKGGAPIPTAVVFPIDGPSLRGALDAAAAGLIEPVLIGPVLRLQEVAEQEGLDMSKSRLLDAADGPAAARQAVAMARAGEAAILMKGDLHTNDLMSAVVNSEAGLRTARRVSHVYVMDVPDFQRLLLLTDAAINLTPTLGQKADIVRNAIELAHILGVVQPRVAILAAVETVSDRMPSTLDAAALCKMADRGQIIGGLLDGPLGLDNAIDVAAALEKAIASPVAGRADILVVPNLEAGNMLAKQLTFLSGAAAAGVVLGARVPIVLTSRADSAATRLASCAVAVLMARGARV